MINKEDRTYNFLARDAASINSLLKESQFMNTYGSKNPNMVLNTYIPIDYYVVVNSDEDSITITTTIRIVNMDTKKVDFHKITTMKTGEPSEDLKNASSAAIREIENILAVKK